MAEPTNDVSLLMRRVSDKKEVIFTFGEFMQEVMKRLKGSDAINDEVIIGEQTLRISSLQRFDGKALLFLTITGGQAKVKVENANEIEPGVFQANYKEAVILIPDESEFRFLRWEGANASEIQNLGEGRYSLMMDSVEKYLTAVFQG